MYATVLDEVLALRSHNAAMRDALQLIVYFAGAPLDQFDEAEWLAAIGNTARKVLDDCALPS